MKKSEFNSIDLCLFLMVLIVFSSFAQDRLNGPGFLRGPGVLASGTTGGGGTPTLISTCVGSGQYNTGSELTQVTGLDCTGATSIWIWNACANNDPTVVESPTFTSGTWTYLATQLGSFAANTHGRWAYVINPVGTLNNLTITSPNPPCGTTITGFTVAGFSGTAAYDNQISQVNPYNGGTAFVVTPITPTQNGALILVGWADYVDATQNGVTTVDSGFTIINQANPSPTTGSYGSGIAYQVQNTAASIGATINFTDWGNNADRVGSIISVRHN